MLRIKVTAENNGRRYALAVPAIIDSDGEITITLLQAVAAAEILRAEAYPKTVAARSFTPPPRRRHKKR